MIYCSKAEMQRAAKNGKSLVEEKTFQKDLTHFAIIKKLKDLILKCFVELLPG